ncbi:unnamed protein product [Schistocephalus solidus]|uniref:Apple domain-containing protein n=1 Tax=Schistocephalus solidus TaxID=70667 RepID=A0A183SMB3_SCHSO|nr:unnamed protein product [Schistocephalus solidus]
MQVQAVPQNHTTSGSTSLPVEDTLHSLAYRLLLLISVPLLFSFTVIVIYHVWKRAHGHTQSTTQFPKVYSHLRAYKDVEHHCRSRSVGHISPSPHANVPFYAQSTRQPPTRRHSCGWYASTDPLDAAHWTPSSAPVMSMEELYVQPNAHLFFGHPRIACRTPPSVQRQSTLSPIKELNGGEGVEYAQNARVGDELQSIWRGVEDIDIFTAAYLHSSNIHKTTESTSTVDLPWDSYEFCNNTSNEFLTSYGAVVLCSPSKSGKWILLRRKTKPLYLCLLAVYVESKSHECFEEVRVSPDGEPEVPAGSVFRLERHVTHGQCRESCMETPVCQAIAFLLRRRTGMCYLLQQFNRTDDSSSAPFTCMPGQNCKIEENICHRDLLEISVIDEFGEAYTCTRLDLTVISVLDKLPAYCELSDQQSKVSLVVLQLIPGGENNTELDMKGGYIQLFDNTRPSALIREVPTIPKMFPTQLNAFENETKNYEHEASNEPLHDTDVTIKSGYSSMSTEAAIPHTTSPELKYAGMEEDYVSNPTGSELNEDALHSTYKAEINEPIDTASIDETLNAFENQTENYEHEASNEPLPDMEVIVKIGYTSTSTEAAIPHTTSPELKYAGMEEEHVSHPTGRGLNEDALSSTYKAEINDPLDTALIDETRKSAFVAVFRLVYYEIIKIRSISCAISNLLVLFKYYLIYHI